MPSPLRAWWCALWIRGDEFHPSLNTDAEYLSTLSIDERMKYSADICKRRNKAHRAELCESKPH